MEYEKARERIIESSKKALEELDKLILQEINLDELDPEKAKQAAQGKGEAIEISFKILEKIREAEGVEIASSKKETKTLKLGPEG